MVKNLSASAGDTGSVPDPGGGRLSPCGTATELLGHR